MSVVLAIVACTLYHLLDEASRRKKKKMNNINQNFINIANERLKSTCSLCKVV